MQPPPSSQDDSSDQHYRVVSRGGLIGGLFGLVISSAGVALATRRYPTTFGRLTLPFRAFLITSSATFGGIVNADHVSIAFQRSALNYQSESQRATAAAQSAEPAVQRLFLWARENRYRIVLASWLASMAAAFVFVRRSPMSTAQKLVQARMYAQGLTLAVLIVTAVFEATDAKQARGRWQTVEVPDPNDPEHKNMIQKRIHKEEFEGQDLWMDIVAAEEKRIAKRKALKANQDNKSNESNESNENSSQPKQPQQQATSNMISNQTQPLQPSQTSDVD